MRIDSTRIDSTTSSLSIPSADTIARRTKIKKLQKKVARALVNATNVLSRAKNPIIMLRFRRDGSIPSIMVTLPTQGGSEKSLPRSLKEEAFFENNSPPSEESL